MQKQKRTRTINTHRHTLPTDPDALIRLRQVVLLTGLGASTIYRLISQGRFPKQMHPLGNKVSAWRMAEVSAWNADRSAGRPA